MNIVSDSLSFEMYTEPHLPLLHHLYSQFFPRPPAWQSSPFLSMPHLAGTEERTKHYVEYPLRHEKEPVQESNIYLKK
jgi:hypothetical protein